MVCKFHKQGTLAQTGTEGCLSKVHRSDVYKLDGRDGACANITWDDSTHVVVWLLGFTPEHDYIPFEDRAKRSGSNPGENELMPSTEGYEALFDEREGRDVMEVLSSGLQMLADAARASGMQVKRGLLGDAVRAEVRCDGSRLFVRFHLPPLKRGVLPVHFQYTLVAALSGVDARSLRQAAFASGGYSAGDLVVDLEEVEQISKQG